MGVENLKNSKVTKKKLVIKRGGMGFEKIRKKKCLTTKIIQATIAKKKIDTSE